MAKRKSKKEVCDYCEDEEKDTTRVASGVRHGMLRFNVKCKCGHIQSMPGNTIEDARDLGASEPCNECNEKQHKGEMVSHYAWMKTYNDAKRAEKARAAEIEAKQKKYDAANKKKAKMTGKKKGKGVSKGKNAGVIT